MEVGQLIFGNDTGEFSTPRYADALIGYLLSEIDRVASNLNKRNWRDGFANELQGVTVRSYWWGDDDAPEMSMPNLKFDFSPQEIRWYKHPGRGQTCSLDWNPSQWTDWFNAAHETIALNDERF